jgi:pseudouridine-5'-phosphate glycosidase
VAVVCAGAKSVLDLARTLELLETLAVPVVGVGTNELPGFYTRDTGLEVEHRVDDVAEAAEMIRARRDLKQGGMVFALPPPVKTALKRVDVERHVKAALALAKKQKIEGKAVTPFLLKEMLERTKGKSLQANLALLENNARYAAKIAVAFGWR